MPRCILALCVVLELSSLAQPPSTRIAADATPSLDIVIAPAASPRTKAAAQSLADFLKRISGAGFRIVEGDGTTGLALGQVTDFPALKLDHELNAPEPARREQYLLRSHERGLYAIGATELAVEHAAWDLLYRLGYRQFFPGESWEVIPRSPSLALAVDSNEKPHYLTRRIWFGFGEWDFNTPAHAAWRARNRAGGAFVLNTGHAYDGIISKYKAEFTQHPEYLGLLNGERKSTKLCVSNAGLRELVVRYAKDFFAKNPQADSVSIDPSDGGGWCECEPCRAIGSPSDRALTLANEISSVLEADYPAKYVALYAYNQHAPPPRINARPRVIVNAATAFLKAVTVEQVIDGWNARGITQFGIREYYGVNTWDRDLPGRSRGSNIDYLCRTITAFAKRGARFMSAESSDSWGPNGLGFYIANRALWDVNEAAKAPQLKTDFLQKCFGPAQAPMEKFYALLDGAHPPLMSSDLVGQMYRRLAEARDLAGGDRAIRARLEHLALYTRYVELFRAYSDSSGAPRQAAFEQLIRHAWRISPTMMIHSKALYRDLAARDKSVTIPAEARFNAPEKSNPWKQNPPLNSEEIQAMIATGIERNRLAGFTPVTFDEDLVPATPLKLPDLPALNDTSGTRGAHWYYTWFDQPASTIELKVTGGLIAHYRDRGDVQVRLYAGAPRQGQAAGDDEEPVDHAAVPPDGQQRTIRLTAKSAGLHRIYINDGRDSSELLFPPGARRTLRTGDGSDHLLRGRREGYFYVPRGTKTLSGYSDGDAAIQFPDGKLASRLPKSAEFFAIEVPSGQDGKLWSVRGAGGAFNLMTVPPCLARSPAELLLPARIIEADRR